MTKRLLGFVTMTALLMSASSSGCSSSSNGASVDAGLDGPIIHRIVDGASGDDGSTAFDGTTGKPCQTDADCSTGAGVNLCSNSKKLFVAGPIFPTPVCILPSCNPRNDGLVHYCDGPDKSTSPGICIPQGTTGGMCYPLCIFAADGSPAVGCVGKDVCNPFGYGVDPQLGPSGVGFCRGGCTSDTDCPTGSGCQIDRGVCYNKVNPPTKQTGQACTSTDSTRGVCDCYASLTTHAGYCTQFCIVGGAACPSGFVCDSSEPAMIPDSTGMLVPAFTPQNQGLAGFCLKTCSGVADAGGSLFFTDGSATDAATDAAADAAGPDASAAAAAGCVNSACSAQNTAGPDCLN